MRDQLVVMRERLFQLTAATAARTKKVEGLLIDCAAAGRVFGAPIGLPDWNKVLAMPGHQFAHSLDEELKEEMERVTISFARHQFPPAVIWHTVGSLSLTF